MERSLKHLARANGSILGSVEGFYWAMVDSSHAALMAYKIVPPSPENIPELLKTNFVDKKILSKEYLQWFEDVRKKEKAILYGETTKLSGKELDELQHKSEDFVNKLNELTKFFIKGGDINWFCNKLNLTKCKQENYKLLSHFSAVPYSGTQYFLYSIK